MQNRINGNHVLQAVQDRINTVNELYQLLTNKGQDTRLDLELEAQRNGMSLLMVAITAGKTAIVKVLLEMGANMEHEWSKRIGALAHALNEGQFEIAELLIKHGARLDAMRYRGYVRATIYGYMKTCESLPASLKALLEGRECATECDEKLEDENRRKFYEAFKAGDLVAAEKYFKAYPVDLFNLQLSVRDIGYEMMQEAVEKGQLDKVKFLVERRGFVTGYCPPRGNEYFPSRARAKGHEEVAVYLETEQKRRYEILRLAAESELSHQAKNQKLFVPGVVVGVSVKDDKHEVRAGKK